jgi:hypothetical protein
MATTLGGGLGGYAAIAAQPTYGNAFVTPTRTLNFKTCKMTYDPHIVQGGPYLAGGREVDIGSAHINPIYLDAKGTLTGDMTNSGSALLLATAFASTGTLTEFGTTTAYQLGGSGGITLSGPDTNNGQASGTCFDMQLGVPTTDAIQHPENYHSCVITKAEWVFDRTGLVTYSYDLDAQYVEKTTPLITPSFSTSTVPYSMSGPSSFFRAGTYGSEAAIDGVRKCTITLERKLDVTRIYVGSQYKELPITMGLTDITVALDTDYTSIAKSALFDLFLAGTPTSIICEAIGSAIGTSGINNTFGLNVTNAFVQTGGESPLDGPDVIKNTISWKGTIDVNNDPALKAWLYTSDSQF